MGLIHDVADCQQGASVKFWARDRLVAKVTGIMAEDARTQRFPPGLAAKLFGCLGFLTIQGVSANSDDQDFAVSKSASIPPRSA